MSGKFFGNEQASLVSGKKGGMTENGHTGNGHIRFPIPLATIFFPYTHFQYVHL
jgi:hypothetical protein